MAVHDYDLANQSGSSFRTDLNNCLDAILSNNSSSTAPSTTVAYMLWADTTDNVLKIRNSSNNGWVTLMQLDGTQLVEDGSAGSPGLTFLNDTNTGMFRSAADKINFSTGGSERLEIDSSGLSVAGGISMTANLDLQDSDKILLGSHDDLAIYHDGSDSVIETGTSSTGDLQIIARGSGHDLYLQAEDNVYIRSQDGESGIEVIGNGAVKLHFDNNSKLETKSDGVDVTGEVQCDSLDVDGSADITGNVTLHANLDLQNSDKILLGSNDDFEIYHDGTDNIIDSKSDQLIVKRGSSEGFRMLADGTILIGLASKNSPDGQLQMEKSGNNRVNVRSTSLSDNENVAFNVHGRNNSAGDYRVSEVGVFKNAGNTNPGGYFRCDQPDGDQAYLWVDNNALFRISNSLSHVGLTSQGTVVGTQSSDERVKNVGAAVAYGLSEIKQLQPKQFEYKKDLGVNKIGFIAQEVESIIPEAVFDTGNELDGHQEGDRTKLGMEYVAIIPVLVNAVKELSAEVDTLKTKVAALEAS